MLQSASQLILIVLLCLSGNLLAETLEKIESSTSQNDTKELSELVAEEATELAYETRHSVAARLFSLTDEIDALFNDIRSVEQREDDWIRLGSQVRFQSAGPLKLGQNLTAGFNLKGVSERLRLVLDADNTDAYSDGERIDAAQDVNNNIPQTNNSSGGSAALRYFLYRSERSQITADAGARFSSSSVVNPIARLRGNTWIELSERWSLEPSQLFYTELDEGFGSRTRADFNRFIDHTKFLRFRNELLWRDDEDKFDLLEEISFFHKFSEDRILSTLVSVLVTSEPKNQVERYRTALRYQRPLIADWLLGSVQPGLDFPEDRDYRATPFITLRLDILFDRQSARDS